MYLAISSLYLQPIPHLLNLQLVYRPMIWFTLKGFLYTNNPSPTLGIMDCFARKLFYFPKLIQHFLVILTLFLQNSPFMVRLLHCTTFLIDCLFCIQFLLKWRINWMSMGLINHNCDRFLYLHILIYNLW